MCNLDHKDWGNSRETESGVCSSRLTRRQRGYLGQVVLDAGDRTRGAPLDAWLC
jgi:hypothetical protein